MKILHSVDVSRVKNVLEELGGNAEGLTKEGVCLAILREVLKRLPHKCVDCDHVVTLDNTAPVSSQCIACKTQLCTNCYQGDYKNVTCSPCSLWIKERYTIPKELYTKHHQKKMGSENVETTARDKEPQSQSSGVETTGGSETLDESLPCGQPRLESTVVGLGPHRGGSILYDTTVVDQTLRPPYSQLSQSVAEQTILANSQQVLENLRSSRSDSAQGGQGGSSTGGGSVAQKC